MIDRRGLWDEVIALLRANRRSNPVEEALRYRSMLDLSRLTTEQLMVLAATASKSPAPIPEQARSFIDPERAAPAG